MQKLKIDEAPAIVRSTGSLTVTFTPAAISLRVVLPLDGPFPPPGEGSTARTRATDRPR